MASYRDVLNIATHELSCSNVPDADIDAWLLFEYKTGFSRTDFFMSSGREMPENERIEYLKLIEKRKERIPLQHITGTQDFMGLTFKISKDTLIPRQDTEVVCEEALKYSKGRSVLDLCTGTGCILLSIGKLGGATKLVGTDVSDGALETARENAISLGLSADFLKGDLFEALKGFDFGTFDMIISNPPYIPSKDIETLSPEVKDHEPIAALDGDVDGLAFYRRITKDAPNYLNKGGVLIFEIGYDEAKAVEGLMAEAGFINIYTKKDLAGLDRLVCGLKGTED